PSSARRRPPGSMPPRAAPSPRHRGGRGRSRRARLQGLSARRTGAPGAVGTVRRARSPARPRPPAPPPERGRPDRRPLPNHWRRPAKDAAEDERERHERLLTAGEEREATRRLAFRRHLDLHSLRKRLYLRLLGLRLLAVRLAPTQDRLRASRVHQPQLAPAAGK